MVTPLLNDPPSGDPNMAATPVDIISAVTVGFNEIFYNILRQQTIGMIVDRVVTEQITSSGGTNASEPVSVATYDVPNVGQTLDKCAALVAVLKRHNATMSHL